MTVPAAARIFAHRLEELLQVASSGTAKSLAGATTDEKRSYLMKKMCAFALIEVYISIVVLFSLFLLMHFVLAGDVSQTAVECDSRGDEPGVCQERQERQCSPS